MDASARVLVVGPGNDVKFRCTLPAAICILSKEKMTCTSADKTAVTICLVNASVCDMDDLADFLADLGCVVKQPRYDDKTERWAKRTRKAGIGVGWAVREASVLAGKGIEKAGELARYSMQRNEEETEVSPQVQRALDATKSASETFSKGVDYLLTGAVSATKFVVKKAVDGVACEENASPGTVKRKTMTESALSATIEVLDSFTDAKSNLFCSAKSATVKTVDHKFGSQAAGAAGDGMDITGNVASVAFLYKPSSVLKKVVKKTARGTVDDVLSEPARDDAVTPDPA